MSRVEVSPAVARGPAGAVARCAVQVEPAAAEPVLTLRFEAPPPVMLVIDERRRVTWAGGPTADLLGRPSDEVVGHPMEQATAALGRALQADVEAVLAGGPAVDRRDLRLQEHARADVADHPGRRLAARIEPLAAPAGDPGGRPGGVVVTLEDPLARARAVQRRRALDALEPLARSGSVEEVARALVEAAVPGLADMALVRVIERDGAVSARSQREADAGPALHALEALLPTPAPDSKAAEHAESAATPRSLRLERPVLIDGPSADDAAAATGLEQVGQLVRDLDVRTLAVVPVRLRGGVALLALASTGARHLDDDDLHAAEAMARRAAPVLDRLWLERRLRRTVHTRERMLSSVGHDLRNPAAAISMAADILISRLPPGDSGSSLKMIHRAANQINALVQKVADESAADAADAG